MDQKNILPRGIAKPIEQQSNGTWIVRHHFRVVGTSENGEELVTFASSEYPEKPTIQQIQRSIDPIEKNARIALCNPGILFLK